MDQPVVRAVGAIVLLAVLAGVAFLLWKKFGEKKQAAEPSNESTTVEAAQPYDSTQDLAAAERMWQADDGKSSCSDQFVQLRSYPTSASRSCYDGSARLGEGSFTESLLGKPDPENAARKPFQTWTDSGLGLASGATMFPGPGESACYNFNDKRTGGLVTDSVKKANEAALTAEQPVFTSSAANGAASFDQAIVDEPAAIVDAESAMGFWKPQLQTTKKGIVTDLRGGIPPLLPDAFWCTGDASLAAPTGAAIPSVGPFVLTSPNNDSIYYRQ